VAGITGTGGRLPPECPAGFTGIGNLPWEQRVASFLIHAERSQKARQLQESFKNFLEEMLDDEDEPEQRKGKKTSVWLVAVPEKKER